MDIPVFIEQTPTGVRASTGAPFNLVADGATYDGALAHLKAQIVAMQNAGRLVTLSVADPDPLIARLAAAHADNPFMAEWAQAVKQIREDSGIPDPDEELFPEEQSQSGLNGQAASPSGSASPARP
jgi:hypothetical protein